MIETHPYQDFIPQNVKYLLLGSFIPTAFKTDPKFDWYYGSKRNQFWLILEEVYNLKLPDRKAKENLLTRLHMGVTDIIYQCERSKGNSLDANLVNIVYNPELGNILRNNKIEKIFFTSRFVENEYRKNFKSLVIQFSETQLFTLPSPSPRYAKMTKDQKVERYKELLPLFSGD